MASTKRLSLLAVLRGETSSPFGLQEFEAFLKTTERSEENLEFYQTVMKYRTLVHEISLSVHGSGNSTGTTNANTSSSNANASLNSNSFMNKGRTLSVKSLTEWINNCDPTDVEKQNAITKLKAECERIISTYFSAGSTKELNLSFTIKKNAIEAISTKKNYHPDVFKPAVDKVLELMKMSSFPHFIR
ncbi:RGS domain-containing protein [Paraphysoderma sedebokerense]|nr:RGS domain-containing protein [Paraphysoderma sedebokerense]